MPDKEAETAETFDEDAYRDELIDKEGYSDETARMKAKKKKESLAARVGKIEIDLGSLAKAKKRVWVKPTATKKGHYREQEVGGDGDKVLAFTRKYHYAPSQKQKAVLAMSQGEKNKKKIDFTRKHGHLPSTVELDNFLLFGKSEGEELEHLSPEERKKRRDQRDKQQKERAAHRAVRRKQHDEIEEGISEGK